jgi:hypothetical protein
MAAASSDVRGCADRDANPMAQFRFFDPRVGSDLQDHPDLRSHLVLHLDAV